MSGAPIKNTVILVRFSHPIGIDGRVTSHSTINTLRISKRRLILSFGVQSSNKMDGQTLKWGAPAVGTYVERNNDNNNSYGDLHNFEYFILII